MEAITLSVSTSSTATLGSPAAAAALERKGTAAAAAIEFTKKQRLFIPLLSQSQTLRVRHGNLLIRFHTRLPRMVDGRFGWPETPGHRQRGNSQQRPAE